MRLGARDAQQDAAYVGPGVVAVADGMGGHARGADASRIALEAFAVAVEGGATLEEAVERADAAVRSLSDGGSSREPGTTLVAARLTGATVQGVWSGDSRAYRLGTDGVLELLTEDHRGSLARSSTRSGPSMPARCTSTGSTWPWTAPPGCCCARTG
jgi:PPM family protein phosphatase